MLGQLAEELYLAAYQLRAVKHGIERESQTKLQGWLEWNEGFAQRETTFLTNQSCARNGSAAGAA